MISSRHELEDEGHDCMAKMLVEAGADLNIVTTDG